MHIRTYLPFFILFFISTLQAQSNDIPSYWSLTSDLQFRSSLYEREIIPEKYITYTLDATALQSQLDHQLPTTTTERREQNTTIYIPNPSGDMEQYTVWRDDLLPKKLNVRYPEISVYAGYATHDPSKTIRMDFTSRGFRAVSYGLDQSTYYIDPIAKGVKNTVMSYYKKDYKNQKTFECQVEEIIEVKEHNHHHNEQRIAGDCDLHTFELALSCTGEYAAFHGGTKASVMAEFTTSINRINGMYEKEISVNLVFVPDTDELIFLNAGTDPFTNNSGGAMLNENQNTCDDIIGNANYDIGHVYSTGGGGVAQLNSPCNNGKARGVTGLSSPVGDPFYVDFVAHEIGHQFGATHTYNNSCNSNRSGQTAYEPGSGSTIMAYAGICPPNVQFNSDAYFHSASLVQIANFLSSTSCEEITSNGSDRPVIAPLQNYNIPVSTPFELTATAAVNDGSSLTYCWEQMDREIANMPPEANASDGPMFRSYTPVASPSRAFPSFPFLLDNLDNEWEVLPTATRELNFRVTVRGSAPGQAGCTEEADLVLNVSNSAGPFMVATPNGNETWTVGETQTVTWIVANTNAAPINCDNVNILLSTDGGFTYPITVLENTPNDGSTEIVVPNFPGTGNRIRVQSVGNVFFDISNDDLTILEPVIPTFILAAQPDAQSACGSNGEIVSYEINASSLAGFDNQVEYTTIGLPNGINASFDNNNAIPNSTSTLNLSGLENVNTGSYSFTVQGNGGGQNYELELMLDIFDSAPVASELLTPADAAADVSPAVTLSWNPANFADGYIIEVSTEPNFGNIAFTTTLSETNTIPENLTTSTVYYWRVKSTNICGEGPVSDVYRFRTGSVSCNTYTNDISLEIPIAPAGTISSVISVPNGTAIEEVNLSVLISHSWIGDLDCRLVAPDGNTQTVFDRPGFPANTFGCDNDNISATFDDDAANDSDDFEDTCGTGPFSIDGIYQPLEAFSMLNGNNSSGDWTLEITDYVDEDGGSLDSWSLEVCTISGTSTPPTTESNNPLTVTRSNSEVITNTELSFSENGNIDNINYTLYTLPSQGTLMKNNILMQIGDEFTQSEINNNTVSYNHAGGITPTDSFIFDVEETNGGWAPNNVFQINIVDLEFSATAAQTNSISCFGDNTGSISVSLNGGTAPYMYSIDATNFQNSNTFNSLVAGEYTVTVLDSDNNSITTNTLILDQPDQLMIEATVNENNVSLSVNGGTGALMYSLDNVNFQNSNLFNNLSNGDYTFTVIDANICMASTEVISISINDLNATASIISQVSCFNGTDGSISVTTQGGSPAFTYALNGGTPQNNNFFENLTAGMYTVQVMDANGFTASTNQVTIDNAPLLTISATVNENQITANGNGGTGAYQYSVDGNSYQGSNIFGGLSNGDYTVYIRDANNCIATTTVNIDIAQMAANAVITSALRCNGDSNGAIAINTSGGIPPYQYSLNGDFSNSNTFENLGAGSYIFTVIDNANTELRVFADLTEPTAISLQGNTSMGTVTLDAQGGTPPYVYAVDNGTTQSNPVFENLSEGQHTALVIDANECTTQTSFSVSINNLVASAVQINEILCAGDLTGIVSISASNGAEPFTYSLDGINFQTESTFEDLGAGQYTFTVRDNDEFTTTINITLVEPDEFSLSAEVLQNTISLTGTGGTPPYEFRLEDGVYQNSNTFENLDANSYQLFIRDTNGCEESVNASINFSTLNGMANATAQVDCAGENSGGINVTVTGGTAPYTYSMNGGNFQASANFLDLVAGDYTFTIRDSNGEEYETNTVEITEPNVITATTSQTGSSVSIDAIGGTGSLSYSIDGEEFQTNNTFSNLINGEYTAYVMDSNGCVFEVPFTINVGELIAIASVSEPVSCFGLSDGGIVVETAGGTNPKEFSLDGVDYQDSNFFTNLSAGQYTITVRDAEGITATTNVVVLNAPTPVTASLDIAQNNLSINAMGGTGTYTYSIDGVNYQNANLFNEISNGAYTVYVQDENECLYKDDFEIDFTALSANIEVGPENLCAGDMIASITITATDGLAPYTYSIDGGDFVVSNLFENLGTGDYNFVVMDASGATFPISNVEITEPAPLNITFQTTPTSVIIGGEGGTPPYQYSLDESTFQDDSEFEILENGEYILRVRDANGCENQTDYTLNTLEPLSIEITVQENLDCSGLTAGSIMAMATGGTAPYLYSLDEGPFTEVNLFEDLPAGQYTVSVQDALMNIVSGLATLSAPNTLEMEIDIIDNSIEIMVNGGAAPYIYSIDGGQTFSDTRIFEDLAVGDYVVMVEDANGCMIEQFITILSVSVSAINHNLILDLAPNPASGLTYLSIENQTYQEINISLIDILGRTVRVYETNSSLGSDKFQIDINNIPSGTYLIRMDMDDQVAVRKLIVE